VGRGAGGGFSWCTILGSVGLCALAVCMMHECQFSAWMVVADYAIQAIGHAGIVVHSQVAVAGGHAGSMCIAGRWPSQWLIMCMHLGVREPGGSSRNINSMQQRSSKASGQRHC
jgi:hypothetical protein